MSREKVPPELTEAGGVEFHHVPVLLEEALSELCLVPGMRVLDCTLGGGGHSLAMLERGARVTGLDVDEMALEAASARLGGFAGFRAFRVNFGSIGEDDWMARIGPQEGALLDLGVSSPQLDRGERGFSIRRDGPLDMRMDRRLEVSAADVVGEYSESDLRRIFFEYGEERQAGKLARRLVQERDRRAISTTGQLVEVAESVLGRPRPGKVHPATKIFQALRMEVNAELERLQSGLEAVFELLVSGGRLLVMSYHSLEDRCVKQFITERLGRCRCPRGTPICVCEAKPLLKARGKAIVAGEAEVKANPRARSVRLRVAQKL
ncbi:16S rRNA (cytosine(1402)-N(4))-methyltransferase RsmH [bacterium]|nr:16S rRNA (cytosine(1402)-N(4))-methyltransferase RsmH [bacterium]